MSESELQTKINGLELVNSQLRKEKNRSKVIIRNMKKRLLELEKFKEGKLSSSSLAGDTSSVVRENEELKKAISTKDAQLKKLREVQQQQKSLLAQIVEKEKENLTRMHRRAFKKGVIGLKEVNKRIIEELTDYKKQVAIYQTKLHESRSLVGNNKFLKILNEKKESRIQELEKELTDVKMYLKHENCGYLRKQGGKVKTMKWRWFIFDQTKFSYYKDRMDKKPLKTIEYSSEIKVIRKLDNETDPLTFALKTPNRTFLLVTSSTSEKERWIMFLESWCNRK